MIRFHHNVLALVLVTCVAAHGDAATPDNSSGAVPAVQNTESSNDAPQESRLLKEEMIVATIELIQVQKPAADPEALRDQVQKTLDTEITKIRKHYPDFLIVSAETEKRLESGAPILSAARRIAVAETTLREFELEIPLLIKELLGQHKAGKLSPIRTELLAQLIVGTSKAAMQALTN